MHSPVQVTITFHFVLASTIYFCSLQAVQNYCTRWEHVKLMWCVQVFGYQVIAGILPHLNHSHWSNTNFGCHQNFVFAFSIWSTA